MPKFRSALTLLVSAALITPAAPALAAGTGSIQVLAPNGGEQLRGTTTISWAYTTGTQVSDASTVTVLSTPDDGETFSVVAASLPIADLSTSWDTSTASDSDDYRIRIRVDGQPARTDNSNSVFTVDNTAPSVGASTLTSPNGGEFLAGGSTQAITWNAGSISDAHLGATPIKLEYTTDGTAYSTIAASEANDGTFDWSVPAIDAAAVRVRITAADTLGNSASDVSDAEIAIDSTDPAVSASALTSPNGGELLAGGSSALITWDPSAVSDTNLASLAFSFTTDGATYTTIAQDEANDGSLAWTVPSLDSESVRVRLTAIDRAGNDATDDSDAPFTIDTTDPGITLTAPSGGVRRRGGDTLNISWVSTDDHFGTNPVAIDYTTDGSTFTSIASGQPANGTYAWTVPSIDSSTVRVRVSATDGAGNTASSLSGAFSVDSTAPTVTLVSPTGGESLRGGSTTTVRFTGSDDVALDGFAVAYSTDGGASFLPIGSAGATAESLPWSVPALDTAGVLLRVTATDTVGNATSATSGGFIIDSTDPSVTIDSPIAGDDVANASEASAIDVSGTTTDALSGVARVLVSASDGTTATPAVSATLVGGTFAADLDISGLDDGAITIRAVAHDRADNDAQATHGISLDATAPAVTLGSTPPTITNQTSASFTFSASETSTFACSLDGADFGSCSSPSNHTGLAEGAHSFAVRATDGAGNTGATTTFTWTIDLTAPVTMITGGPADPTADTSATFVFNADELASFMCSIDGGLEEACVSPKVYSGLSERAHTFSVRATDPAGNAGPTARRAWTIDVTGPTVNLTGPASPTNATTAELTFASPDGGVSFRCSLDGGAAADCTSPVSLSGLADGTHNFGVSATDTAGNQGGQTTVMWVVDTVAPTATITSRPADPAGSSTANFSVASSESGLIECKLDGAGFEDCSTGSIGYSALGDGGHTFSVRATDPAGNTGVTVTYGWTVDTVAPTVSIGTRPAAYSPSASATFSFSANEDGVSLACRLDGGAPTDCSGGTASFTGLTEGTHTLQVAATDAADNAGPAASSDWVVDLTAPAIGAGTLTAPNGGELLAGGATTDITWTAADITDANLGAAPLSLSLSSDDGVSFDPVVENEGNDGTFSWTVPLLDTGRARIRITARDLAGNTSSDASNARFVIDSSAPSLSLDEPGGDGVIGAAAAAPYALTGNASDAGAGLTNVRVSATDGTTTLGPADATLGDGTFTGSLDLTGLSEGSIFLHARATDGAGRITNDSASATLDLQPPTVSISGPIGGDGVVAGSESGALTVTGSASDSLTAVDTVRLTATVGTQSVGPVTAERSGDSWTATLDLSALPDGTLVVRAKATDLGGNAAAAEATATLDTTGPTASILTGPGSLTSDDDAAFTLEASEPGATLSCRLDDGAASDCSGGSATYAGLPDGEHTFSVRATDAAGNTGSAAVFTWRVDTVAPIVTITTHPAARSGSASATFAFEADEPGASFACQLDDAPFEACPSDGKSYADLSDGSHTFRVRATDDTGNVGGAASFTWEVDIAAPTVTITAGPRNPTNATTAAFTFGSDDGGIAFSCSLDGDPATDCSGGSASYTALTDGAHSFAVRATDAAGNMGREATFSWTVDTVAPTVTINDKPTSPTSATSASFSFASADGSVRFSCTLDDGVASDCSTGAATYSALADGAHTFAVRATDAAGNTGAAATHDWRVDTAAPTVTISDAPAADSPSSDAAFTLEASEPGSTLSCILDDAAPSDCSDGSVSYSALSDGTHTFQATATDTAGNTGPAATHSWRVDTVAPVTTITSQPAAQSGSVSATFAFEANEPGATFACRLDDAPFEACPSDGTTYTDLADGTHTFRVRATDAAGNTGPIADFAWTVDTTGPTVTITAGPDDPTNAAAASFSFGSDDGGISFSCSLDDGPSSDCSEGSASFSALADGVHTFAVRATDEAGNTGDAATFGWTVDTVAPTVTITAGPDDPTNATAASFSFGSDDGGISFSCSLDDGPSSDCSEGSASFSALADGVHTFAVRATDETGNTGDAATFGWTVDTVAPVATITGHPAAESNSIDASFTFEADEADSSFECQLDDAAFEACPSGGITYTNLADGSHMFRVRATDAVGNTGEAASFTWELRVNVPPVILDDTPGAITNFTTATFAFHTMSEETTFECSLDGASYASCASPTAYVALADGSHSFSVRALLEGRTGRATTFGWIVDTVAPTVAIASGPADPSASTDATFGFEVSEESARLECQMDEGDFSACENPASFSGLTEGSHTLRVRASDALGNTSETRETSWTIDLTAPEIEITSAPEAATTARSATVSFTVSDPEASVRCALDGAASEPCADSVSFEDLADGPHTLRIVATDVAGNEGQASPTWTVDNVAPTLATQVTPNECAGGAWCNAQVVRVIVTATDPGSGLSLDPSGTTEVTEEGVQTLSFTARDEAGNETSATVTLRIDRQAPQTTIVTPAAESLTVQPATGIVRVTGTVTDRPAGQNSGAIRVRVYLCRTVPSTTPAPCFYDEIAVTGSSWSWQPSTQPPPGRYGILVYAIDAAGNGPADSSSSTSFYLI